MKYFPLLLLALLSACAFPASAQDTNTAPLLAWMRSIPDPVTTLPVSFKATDPLKAYRQTGAATDTGAVLERMMLRQGISIYDTAVWQIALASTTDPRDLAMAAGPVDVYWKGQVNGLSNLRGGSPAFVYTPSNPVAISGDPADAGRRGFIFRLIDSRGLYYSDDPLDRKTTLEDFPNDPRIHWEDWKPIAGENAWAVLAALRVYEASGRTSAKALALAKEITVAALLLQAENGGIRMAPLGTYCYTGTDNSRVPMKNIGGRDWPLYDTIFYNVISTENNISWYAALRRLNDIAPNPAYAQAIGNIERYFRSAWNPGGYFDLGANFSDRGRWVKDNKLFAVDAQTWAIAAIGPEKIDAWFGEGAAWKMWEIVKERSGHVSASGELNGVGYSDEHDRVSIEWSAGAVLAARELATYYKYFHTEWAEQAKRDAITVRQGLDLYRLTITEGQQAYAYSSKRGWIPFGWQSLDPSVASLASTAWIYLIDKGLNPFQPASSPAIP